MNFHPYAEIFPLIDDGDFDELAEDIKAHGLREPIWIYEGQVLDGRNRFMACAAAKVEPKFRDYTGDDPLGFVLSLNIHRRHMSASQRAMAAAEIATLSRGRPKTNVSRDTFSPNEENGSRAPISQTEAADRMHVSRESVNRAKKVLDSGSKQLQNAVKSGEVPVKKAAAVVDLPKSQQLAAAKAKPAPDPDEPERPDDIDEDAALAAAEADYARRIAKVMESDDKLAEANAQLRQQSALIATLEMTRDGYMRGKEEITKLLKAEQRKTSRLEKELERLRKENA